MDLDPNLTLAVSLQPETSELIIHTPIRVRIRVRVKVRVRVRVRTMVKLNCDYMRQDGCNNLILTETAAALTLTCM